MTSFVAAGFVAPGVELGMTDVAAETTPFIPKTKRMAANHPPRSARFMLRPFKRRGESGTNAWYCGLCPLTSVCHLL
jgi:hypothetical protein